MNRSEKKYLVYAIQCIENKKMYIGLTSQSTKNRVYNHLQLLRNGKHTAKDMLEDFKKYGEQKFVVYEMEDNIAYQDRIKEKKYMEQYKTYDEKYGYNSRDSYFKKRPMDSLKIIKGLPEDNQIKGQMNKC